MAVAPLKAGFFLTSLIGFLVSVLYVPRFSVTWAFAFGIVFTIMFVASIISMAGGSVDEQLSPVPKKVK